MNDVITFLTNWVADTGLKISISIILIIIGFKLINLLSTRLEKQIFKGNHQPDKTLVTTVIYIFKIVLKTILITCLIGYIGVDTSGIAALIASLGVGLGLAINGAVSNLAGGILLILTRPFKIDDFIEAEGFSGTVEEIKIITTKIKTPDNKVVYIPNGKLSSDTIINYSEKDTRRVDFTFNISYNDSFFKAKEIILSVMYGNDMLLSIPEPLVRISNHGKSAIEITARGWVKSQNYWDFKFEILEKIKGEFDKAGISIPYNQLDVHIKNDQNG